MQNFYELGEPSNRLRQQVVALCQVDPDFSVIELEAGPLQVLQLPPTFQALVRIIVGQQLSTKAARTIYGRLEVAIALTPESLLEASDETLRAVGLSRAKLLTCRAVAQAFEAKAFEKYILDFNTHEPSGKKLESPDAFNLASSLVLEDDPLYRRLLGIKGIGPWTAELFMLFALEHPHIFPAGDLAIRRGYAHLKHLNPVPEAKALNALVKPITPHKSAATHLLWHYYRHLSGNKIL
jgi:DNA-3-methyladenine glycosylase II